MLQGIVTHPEDSASADDTNKSSIAPTMTITPPKTESELDDLLSKAEKTVEQLEIVHSPLIDEIVAHDPNAAKAKGIFLRTTSGVNLQVLNSVGTDEYHLNGELTPEHQRVVDPQQGIWRVETLGEAVDRKTKIKNKN